MIICLILVQYGGKIISYFDNREETIDRIQTSMFSILTFIVLESTYGIMMGVVKGIGYQNMAVVWTFIGYFFIGLPMAAFCAEKARALFGWQNKEYLGAIHNLNGIYVGFNFACIILDMGIFYIIYSVNWDDAGKLSNAILSDS